MMEVVPAFILNSSGYFCFSFLFILHRNRDILEIKGFYAVVAIISFS